ncbi:ComEC/Rec2 family competence protein [Polaribacter tangerinus]|uniref:ComEC/Rec2 family competence protein n=1 Tax=Polaribacter tangerinus TaxID=1920034 RepID=UPI000B4B033B|nr:ComEC/Rec2 family competence protein [Polaribacter tangerinus]
MSKLIKYVPFHVLIGVIVGILIAYYFKVWSFGFRTLFLIFLLFLVLLRILKNKLLHQILAFSFYIYIGVSSVFVHNSQNYRNYFYKVSEGSNYMTLKIVKVLKNNIYNHKYKAEVVNVANKPTSGFVLLHLNKDSINSALLIDDRIVLKTEFLEILPPLNLHQFHYKNYLQKQDVFYQVSVKSNQFNKLPNTSVSLLGYSSKIRNYILLALKKQEFKEDVLAVISALLLGQRQDISADLLNDYANAGAIHILAVSGLHVGVILLILSYLLSFLKTIKHGKYLKAILLILFLWSFAFIAGLSASVVRAVTMFTFLTVGSTFNKKSVVAFSLIASMLFLLIIKPLFLFDVGFQLSYLAVFGIIWVQPALYNVFKFKYFLLDKAWLLLSVSVAAQVGILPLSIYYFKQFPGLFMFSNLIIIPFLSIILLGGILIIILSLISILPHFLKVAYEMIITSMNTVVHFISMQEKFLLKDIFLSTNLLFSSYFLVFMTVFFLMKPKPKKAVYFFCSLLVFQTVYFYELKVNQSKKEFVIFHKYKHSLIANREGAYLNILKSSLSSLSESTSFIKNYLVSEKIKKIQFGNSYNYYHFQNKDIMLVDSLGIYKVDFLKKPIVVLQNSPKINLERLIIVLQPSQIVVDGSNFKTDAVRWQKIAEQKNIPFFNTAKKGAFVLRN